MWLSLMSTASNRPKRWLAPPPARTAYFSKARRPGVVFRVQTIFAPVPATASTKWCVAVATPLRCCTRFSATRSAERIARVLPESRAIAVPAPAMAPSSTRASTSISGSSARNAAAASGRPAMRPSSRKPRVASQTASAGISALVVMSPARPRSSASAALTVSATRWWGNCSPVIMSPPYQNWRGHYPSSCPSPPGRGDGVARSERYSGVPSPCGRRTG